MNICRDETLAAVRQLFASFNDVQVSSSIFTGPEAGNGGLEEMDSFPLLRHLQFADGVFSHSQKDTDQDDSMLDGNANGNNNKSNVLTFMDSFRVVASKVLRQVLTHDRRISQQHTQPQSSPIISAPLPRLLAARLLMAIHTCDRLATPLAETPVTPDTRPPAVILSLFCSSRVDLLNACAHILLPFPVGHDSVPHPVPETPSSAALVSLPDVVDVVSAADRLALEGYIHGELLSLCDGVLMQSRVLARVQGRMSMDSHLEPFESLFQRAINELDASLHGQERDDAASDVEIETRGVYSAIPSGLPSALTASGPRAIIHPSGCVLEPNGVNR
jgi:hypothetical protein